MKVLLVIAELVGIILALLVIQTVGMYVFDRAAQNQFDDRMKRIRREVSKECTEKFKAQQ